jgi:type I restriction enzyme S subunit
MKFFRLHDAQDHVTSEGVDSGSALAPAGSTLLLVRGMTLHERVPVCLISRPMAFNQDVKALIAKQGVEKAFLAYWLAANEDLLLNRVDSASHGTGRILSEALRSVPLTLPPLSEQKRIVDLFASLDDKIELNRRMNKTLNGITGAIFKSWFAASDTGAFDKAEGVAAFSSVATISRESVTPADHLTESLDHYSIPAFDNARLPSVEKGAQIKSNKFVVHDDSVLLSKLNPRIPRVWMPVLTAGRRAICSTEFLVLEPTDSSSREYLYDLCMSQSFLDVFATMVTGTSGSHQRVKPEYLEQMPVVVPRRSWLRRYTAVVRPLHSKVAHNLRENLLLADLRDTLLPKLMCGDVRINDAEKTMAPA